MKKHSKQQWKKQKKKSSDPWARSGRGLAGDMGLNFLFFFFCFSMVFCSLAKNLENTKKKFRPMGKVWAIHTQTKKPKNQKKQETKKTKKKKKTRLHTPRGGGQMQSVGSCLLFFFFFCFCFFFFVFFFVFFVFFLFFWFFGLCVDSHCRCAKQRLPGTVSGCTRGRAGKNQKKQETKKPKKKQKKQKKTKIAHPKGRGSDAECWVLSFCFFVFFF